MAHGAPIHLSRPLQVTVVLSGAAVSGGYGLDSADAAVLRSFGNGRSWIAEAENPPLVATAHLTVYAYCAPGVTFVP